MPDVVLLDAGPLGIASHPRLSADILAWISRLFAAGVQLFVPEIAVYEVRRELLRANRLRGVQRLDELKARLGYLPITTDAMLHAAQLWADARRRADGLHVACAIVHGIELVVSWNYRHIANQSKADAFRAVALLAGEI